MKFQNKLFTVLGVLALSGLVAMAGDDKKAEGAKIGAKAPDFKLTDIDGKEHALKDHAGKIVVLDWVNPKCPVCKAAHEDDRIPNMIKELEKEGAVFLAINTTHNTTAEENKEALKHYGVEYDVLLDKDGAVGHAYGAKTTPHIFVIDTQGVLRYQGALDNGGQSGKPKEGELINYAINAVKQIKAGETVSPDHIKSYGCNVKFAPKEKAQTQ